MPEVCPRERTPAHWPQPGRIDATTGPQQRYPRVPATHRTRRLADALNPHNTAAVRPYRRAASPRRYSAPLPTPISSHLPISAHATATLYQQRRGATHHRHRHTRAIQCGRKRVYVTLEPSTHPRCLQARLDDSFDPFWSAFLNILVDRRPPTGCCRRGSCRQRPLGTPAWCQVGHFCAHVRTLWDHSCHFGVILPFLISFCAPQVHPNNH
jgi:hypothetical protein